MVSLRQLFSKGMDEYEADAPTSQTSDSDEPADVSCVSQTSEEQLSKKGTGGSKRTLMLESSSRRLLERMASATLSIITGGLDEDGEMKYLSVRSATCILINFISVGYILLPSGKSIHRCHRASNLRGHIFPLVSHDNPISVFESSM
jgi:hypothetical protein